MLFHDPPVHTRLRALAGKAFTRSLTKSIRVRIQRIVDSLIDRVSDAGVMDLIADFAFPLPVCVIAEVLGVAAADRDRFLQWSLDMAEGRDATSASSPLLRRSAKAYDAIAGYFRDLIIERRKRPQADLLTWLIEAEREQDRLTEPELLATCGLLFVAGHETTVNLIGNGMLALLKYPGELQRLREDVGLLPSAVEELLRYDSPVQRAGRVANSAVEIGGKTIRKGAVVLAMLGAANRDPAQFPKPNLLDISRRDNHHLAFGSGPHFCLGAPLARLEAQIAIGTLLRRMPKLSLATRAPEWRNSLELRGLKELQLTF
jgi:cytochrome P450